MSSVGIVVGYLIDILYLNVQSQVNVKLCVVEEGIHISRNLFSVRKLIVDKLREVKSEILLGRIYGSVIKFKLSAACALSLINAAESRRKLISDIGNFVVGISSVEYFDKFEVVSLVFSDFFFNLFSGKSIELFKASYELTVN